MIRSRELRRALWTSAKPVGLEYCEVNHSGDGWTIDGTLVRSFKEGDAGVVYRIRTDDRWNTRHVRVSEMHGGVGRRLELSVKSGGWTVNGKVAPALAGCVDVDLEASPVTNSLPLKRARLRIGERKEFRMAWVRFPSLGVVPLVQSYERTGKRKYTYRSLTGFVAEIEVDGFGLVRRYGNYWSAT